MIDIKDSSSLILFEFSVGFCVTRNLAAPSPQMTERWHGLRGGGGCREGGEVENVDEEG